MDFDSIPYGVDFREHIAQTLEEADIVIAVIGPAWLGHRGESIRRIDDATDFVRLEIAGALQRGIPVIPILVDKTTMPREDTLPHDLKPLAFRNALVLDSGIDFHHHVDRLIGGIRGQLKNIQSSARRSKQKIRDRTSGQPNLDSGHKVTVSGRFKWLGVLDKLISSAPSPQQNQERDVRPLSQPSVVGPITVVPTKMVAQEKASKQKRPNRPKKQSIQPQDSFPEPPPPAAVPAAAPVQEQAIAPPPPVGATAVEKQVIAASPTPVASPVASVRERPTVLPSPSVAAASLSAGAKKPQKSLFSGKLLGLILAGGLVAFVTYFVVISRSKSTTNVQSAVPSPLITPDVALSASPIPQQNALAAPAYDEGKRLESEEKIQHPAESSPASTAAQTPHDSRPIYVVIAPESKGLNIRSDPSAKSTIIKKLQHGDQVFLEDGHIRNDNPPYPVTWQKVTTMDGATGWIDFDYVAPKDANQSSTPAAPESPASAPATEDTEVGRLFEKWLSAGNAGDTEQEASLYAEPADYLDWGMLGRQELVQALQRDLQRWPKQHFTVSKGPLVEKLSESEWRVTFAIKFDARDPSKGKQVTGTANLTWLVRRRESGELEIASSKEQVTSRTRHDLKRGGP